MDLGPEASADSSDTQPAKKLKSEATAAPADTAAAASGAAAEQLAAQQLLLSECHRYAALAELRKAFERRWKATWGFAAPAEAFNAWLFEALNSAEADWPPIPGPWAVACSHEASPAIQKWALLQVPTDWPYARDLAAAHRNLERYVTALKSPKGEADLQVWEPIAAEEVDAAAERLRAEVHADPASVLRAVQQILQPLAATSIAASVLRLSKEIVALSDEIRQTWSRRCQQSCNNFGEQALHVLVACADEPSRKKGCNAEASKVRLEMKGSLPEGLEGKLPRRFAIHRQHFEKLQKLFQKSTADAAALAGAGQNVRKRAAFEASCWALLLRYQALFGPHDEGAGWHMALSPQVMESLVDDFEVECELFASPLNCSLPAYCSLFVDCDSSFASCGSFFRFCCGPLVQRGGSFECNPPFEEHLMRRVVEALLTAMGSCSHALSVALVLPDWPGSGALAMAETAECCRACVRIAGESHSYLNGRQHSCQPKHRIVRHIEGRGSCVIFLQNVAGESRWPATEQKLQRHRDAWAQRKRKSS